MVMKRHIGRITNTDKRCVILFMQLQDEKGDILDPDSAMVVDSDALPDRLHQPLMEIVESVEGQNTPVLATLLARRIGPDFGVDMFTALAQHNTLQKVPVDNITMFPEPNQPIALRKVLEGMGRIEPRTESEEDSIIKFNPHSSNQQAIAFEEKTGIASGLLREASDLEAIASAKRAQAYKIAPSLEPKKAITKAKTAKKPTKKKATKKTKKAA